jgi:predicted GNAT superfamily acetyltransferase
MNELDERTWAGTPIPVHQTLTVAKNGGIVLGAYDGEKMIGFLYSFPGFLNGETYLCSHMLAVDSLYRNQGLGYQLKMEQAQVAAQAGYQTIRWTYDPLECKNAYLNLTKLGAICSDYIVNCYGEMQDALNKGLPSDRFNVEWLITSPYLEQRGSLLADHSPSKANRLLDWEISADGFPVPLTAHLEKVTNGELSCLSIAVPNQFQEIKKASAELALDWRLKTRDVFQHAFANGWAVVHVTAGDDEAVRHYLLLQRSQLGL